MVIFYFLISFLASIGGAISGIGGGVIIKPVMDLISPLDIAAISFLSGTTVLSMTCVSIFFAKRNGLKGDSKKSVPMGIGGIIGGLGGKYLFDLAKQFFPQEAMVGAIQSGLLTALTFGVMLYIIFRKRIKTLQLSGKVFCLLTGIILGSLSAFLGIGGGPINIIVFSFFFSMSSKESAINSITVIFFSQVASLILTLVTGNLPTFDPLVPIFMMAGGMLGAVAGSKLSKKLSNDGVSNVFVGIMSIIIAIGLYNFVNFLNSMV